jgi:hypothetical protein
VQVPEVQSTLVQSVVQTPPGNPSLTQMLLAQSLPVEQASPTLPDPAQAEKASKKNAPSGFTVPVYPAAASVLRCLPMYRTLIFLMVIAGTAGAQEEPVPPGQRGEPVAPGAAPPKPAPLDSQQKYAIGWRFRYIFVPNTFFQPYLQASTQMNSVSTGMEFIYRKETYDVVTSLDFSYLNVDDGNWLANGHDPSLDSHYTQFRSLSFLSADVSIIGHHTWAGAPWFELRYGAGVGLGVVFGDVLLTNNFTGCTVGNVSNIAQCHPLGVDLTAKNYEDQLAATEKNNNTDTAQTPHRHVSQDKWPAAPVINILMGAKFRLHPHVSLQVELGFRDAMFFGTGLHYWF